MRLAGKVAVVTGGAQGIGLHTAALFAREGAVVYLVDIDREAGSGAAEALRDEGLDVRFVPADVAREEDLADLYARVETDHQGLDVVVNNAGLEIRRGVLDASLAEWERCLAVNLKGVWLAAKLAVPLMQKRGGGSIVNISSMHGIQTSIGSFPYATTKSAVIGLTRNMAVDFGRYGIRANVICPGLVETRMSEAWIRHLKTTGKWQGLLATHPLGRPGAPEEIARVALFFASGDASFVTGACLFADGGHHAVIWNYAEEDK
ncbi:MAG: SDR family NAD(P)-dependent oxidoreductase [Bacteroidota bacterium]